LSCSHPRAERERLFAAADYVTGDGFHVECCRACGLAQTRPRPRPAEMGRYYPVAWYRDGARGHLPAVAFRAQRALYRRRAARVETMCGGRPGRVLDIGCGSGLLLQEFRRRGWRCEGTELSERIAGRARRTAGIRVRVGELTALHFQGSRFDAIVLWHVLEHVPDPAGVLAEVARLLRPGGIVMVGVPNFGSPEARLTRAGWYHLAVPRHLSHFTYPTITRLVAEAGLRIRRASFLAPEYDTISFIQSALNCLGVRRNALSNWLSGREPRRDVGRSAVVASLVLALPLAAVAVPVTVLAGLARRGATMSLLVEKPPGGAHPGLGPGSACPPLHRVSDR
jgi:SAM-dependent methyltransferase